MAAFETSILRKSCKQSSAHLAIGYESVAFISNNTRSKFNMLAFIMGLCKCIINKETIQRMNDE